MTNSKAQAAIRRKLLAAARLARPAWARNGRAMPRAWLMTDPGRVTHPDRIAANLPSGFGVIYRHFGAPDRIVVGARLARACKRRRLILLVAADPKLAHRIAAAGVHWPEALLRQARPSHPLWIETASAHSLVAVFRAARLGVDAVILSSVFDSASKSARQPIGAMRFASIAHRSPVPVYALGGITSANAARATTRAAGWAGIDAVVSAWKD
jgi:thiamine-phosphate pyrophosphorylase